MTATKAHDLADEFRELRHKGWTYREIGEKYGFSHERIRQVLGPDEPGTPTYHERRRLAVQERAEKINDYLREHGVATREQVMEEFDLSATQLNELSRDGVETSRILSTRNRAATYDTDGLNAALNRVWGEVKADHPSAEGLSHSRYDEYRRGDEPSAALIVSRMGWITACKTAGIPSGTPIRETYTSQWEISEILGWVRRYADACAAEGKRPSYLGYEEFQREHDDAPSGSTIRNRLRSSVSGLWSEIVAAAYAEEVTSAPE
jgi:hypothetical protein